MTKNILDTNSSITIYSTKAITYPLNDQGICLSLKSLSLLNVTGFATSWITHTTVTHAFHHHMPNIRTCKLTIQTGIGAESCPGYFCLAMDLAALCDMCSYNGTNRLFLVLT